MKKTLATVTMALVLGCSTVFANGGIIIMNRDNGPTKVETCSTQGEGILVSDRSGILVSDRSGVVGAIVVVLSSFFSDKGGTCTPKGEGILVSDRSGILVSD